MDIDWPTRVITVYKTDTFMSLVSGSLYNVDTNALRLALKAEEDGTVGMAFPDITSHNTEVTLGGITYARTLEIVNGYTITFDDTGGGWVANLTGSNNNIADVTNPNSVQVRSNNSAGLQVVTSGSGLSAAQATMLAEVWKLLGLDLADPVTITPTGIDSVSGDIDINFSGDGVTSTTQARQP